MSSLFDDHRTTPQPRRGDAPAGAAPARPPAPRPTPPARAHRFPPALTGMLVTLAALFGVAVGHEAWRSTAGSPVTSVGDLGASPGAGAYSPGPVYVPGYGGSVGAAPTPSVPAQGSTGVEAAVAAKVNPALVTIDSTFGYRGVQGAGTGIVLRSDGEVLTNNHVVDGASAIKVTDVGNGRTYRATVVGYDKSHDIAVLRLENAAGLQTATLGDSSSATVGQPVVAIGNAGGSGSPTSAAGSITALDRAITAGDSSDGSSERLSGLIEVDANVQPGDSGGSLVDSSGRVIGVDTAASAGFSMREPAGRGYAVPINLAMSIVGQIESGQGTAAVHVGPTAFLGVLSTAAGRQAGGPSAGALLAGVADGGAAQRAGLVAGDTITSLAGKPIDSQAALSRLILGLKPGDNVALGWVDQSGLSHTATVDLGTGPPA